MKKSIPTSLVVPGHPDYVLLDQLAKEVLRRGNGPAKLKKWFAQMLRDTIDWVIETPKTGRHSIDQLASTEKTYLGTRVEIEIKGHLNLRKGKLDAVILGHDVDIKNTVRDNWMIPREGVGHPMLLVAADEETAKCYLGLFVAHDRYLTPSNNQDKKRGISAAGFQNILWLVQGEPYPANFWRGLSPKIISSVISGPNGNARVSELFRLVQKTPISRDVIDATARQRDFMRRVRSDKSSGRKGTKDILAEEGVLVLNGHYDSPLIRKLGLPPCGQSEFVSYRPQTQAEADLAVSMGVQNLKWKP